MSVVTTTLMFSSNIDIVRWFRACPACESFLPPIDLLCRECWRALSSISDPHDVEKSVSGLEFPIRSLFQWTDANEHLVHPMLLGFKGGASARIAREFVLMLSEGQDLRDVVFIPAPSSKKDHAYLLAKTAAELWDAPLLTPLRVVGDQRRQRDKTKEERKNRKFDIRTDMADLIRAGIDPDVRIIFIDDVITTGATVSAAYEALGKPKGFEAWSLARRPRLATKQGF